MNTKKWVQHISGQGERWQVRDCEYNNLGHNDWCVNSKKTEKDPYQSVAPRYHWLPKSEFPMCDPPEEWEDVSKEYESFVMKVKTLAIERNERFKVVEQPDGEILFKIERRKS